MKKSGCYHCEGINWTRRDFLRAGTLSLLGLNFSDVLRAQSVNAALETTGKKKAQSVIMLWLEGGISQMDTWDVKPSSSFKAISTNASGVQISELFPRVARHMDKLSIVRTMQTIENNHAQATIETLTGHRPSPATKYPSFGSIIAKEMGSQNNMPPFVVAPRPRETGFFEYAEGFQASFIGSQYDGMVVPDPSSPNFQVPDLSLPKSINAQAIDDGRTMLKIVDQYYRQKEETAAFVNMDSFEDQALRILMSPKVKEAFDLSKETEKTKDAYGRNRVGQSCLLARRLVEGGCRFVTADGYKEGQWDTHVDNEKHLKEDLAPLLDQSLAALMADLKERGLLDSTVVIVTGEFGRTPIVNPKAGRDHWPNCWSLLVGGGGIAGGQIVGTSDKDGSYVADRPVSIGDLYATVYKAMGIDWKKTYMSPLARPLYIANGFKDMPGDPLKEIV